MNGIANRPVNCGVGVSCSLYGHDGDDVLVGGNGRDFVVGATGNDLLIGRNGRDVFVFNAGSGSDTLRA